MILTKAPLNGVYIVEIEKHEDIRGFFARTFDIDEFKKHNIDFSVVQSSISYNKKRGTLRGMHYQRSPYEENKLIHCINGSIYDVVIDLRYDSPTYKKWFSIELSHNNLLYIPKGFAHGYLTIEDDTLIYYFMSEFYHQEYSETIKWNDPIINVKWKFEPTVILSKDE